MARCRRSSWSTTTSAGRRRGGVRDPHARARASSAPPALRQRARRRGPAVRRTDRDQGPQPDRRHPHHLRLTRLRRLRARRLRRRHAGHGSRGHGQPRQDLDARVRVALLHRARGARRRPSRRGTGPGWRAAPPVARPPPWPPAWCPSPRAPTAVARSGSPRRAADSSGSSRRVAGSRALRCMADPVGLATAGAISRTVRDAAAMLDVLAGRGVGDPSWAPPPSETFLAACDRKPPRLRIARFIEPVIADTPVDPECVRAWEDASALLESLGHEVVDIAVPLPADARPGVRDLLGGADRAVGGPSRGRADAAAADPVAHRARPRGVGAGVRAGDRRAAADRRRRAGGPGAVRRGADADAGRAAAAGRRDPQRRRPGRGLRGAEGLHPVDVGLERDRHAGRLAPAALDPRRACPSA